MVGRCQKDNECPKMFLYFLVISVITSYTLSLGGIPGYILLLRCIKPQLKSFALGIYTLAIRVLAGIPAPVYFGVLIDTSCLKWGFKRCGSRGSCRLYDSNVFRYRINPIPTSHCSPLSDCHSTTGTKNSSCSFTACQEDSLVEEHILFYRINLLSFNYLAIPLNIPHS
ncbi:solute carrier organic anion transporter family member 1C1 [Phyllostomus discolor]|uniref:Solute carrier organic anion transporter family member 1C1 n=1 Tax=Phyllostomus discolor TaxID=89673 RepID=A0A834EM02_9CHIR|nr:solute carrier organic anion transporter family member 1C1 [Phyllostomus discolor]